MNAKVTQLLDRYLEELGDHLPVSIRKDVEKEMRSTIEDMLDDRSQGSEPTEELLCEILRETGDPQQAAQAYLPERYLIGPWLFPTYTQLLKIFALVLIGVHILLFSALTIFSTPAETSVLEVLQTVFISLVNSGFQMFGTITLIFALVEWQRPRWGRPEIRQARASWNPDDLLQSRVAERISLAEMLWSSGFIFFMLVIFNFFPENIGVYNRIGDQWTFFPILTPAFQQLYLPILNLLWIASLALNIILLGRGNWNRIGRVVSDVLNILWFFAACYMVMGPAFTLPLFNMLNEAGVSIGAMQGVPDPLTMAVEMTLLIVTAVPLFRMVGRFLKKK